MSKHVWFITGASRGFGAAIVESALSRGDAVAATSRRPADIVERFGERSGLLPLQLDVTDPEQARIAVVAARDHFGEVTVVVNNAGYGLIGTIEEAADDEARAVFDTNVFGLLNVTRACLPTLRNQRHGHVINIGSISGIRGTPGLGLYNATKFAVAGITEALRAELKPLGINVMVVELGQLRTGFLAPNAIRFAADRIEDYAGGPSEMVRTFATERHRRQPGDPRRAAELLIEAIESDNPPGRLPLGKDTVAGLESKLEETVETLKAWRERAADIGYKDGED